jgi:hypothetical protein
LEEKKHNKALFTKMLVLYLVLVVLEEVDSSVVELLLVTMVLAVVLDLLVHLDYNR